MKLEILIGVAVTLPIVAIGLFLLYKLRPKKLNIDKYIKDWLKIQSYCRQKNQWPMALEAADNLLNSVLKRRRFKGKSMGERLVSAQRLFSTNESLWLAHNYVKKVKLQPTIRLKEEDVKSALIAFRQALKDLGALPDGHSKDS